MDLEQVLNGNGSGCKPVEFRKRQVIFSQGDAASRVFYIERGSVKLSVTSKEGKEAVVGILGPGDFFGEDGIAGRKVRMTTAAATTDCGLVRIGNGGMSQMLHQNRLFSDFFMSYLLTRKARVEADLVDQLFNSSEKRLARALLVMAQYGRKGKAPSTAVPKVSQKTLASMVGTTRSRVSFFMNKFRKLGFIHYNGGLQVRASLMNIVLHD